MARDVRLLSSRVLAALALTPLLGCDARRDAAGAAPAPSAASQPGLGLRNPVVVPDPYPPGQKWCATKNVAWKIASPRTTSELGCPKFVEGPDAEDRGEGDPYAGLGYDVLGHWDPRGTDDRRESGDADACCYNWRDEEGKGRPLVVGGRPLVARAGRVSSSEWIAELRPAAVPRAVARRLAAAWTRDALAEHASVGAFARAALELLAVGAPADLVGGVHEAALDEVRHARACFGLAAAYGERRAPGRLPAAPVRDLDLVEVAVCTLEEAAIGETVGALAASRAARLAVDPVVRAVLEEIADDETRHAVVAWRTVAWAAATGGEPVRRALRAAARRWRRDGAPRAEAERGATLEPHGRLGAATLARAGRDALAGVVAPALAAILGGQRGTASRAARDVQSMAARGVQSPAARGVQSPGARGVQPAARGVQSPAARR